VTLTQWTKDERVIDVTRTTRFKIQSDGTLLIKPVAQSDEGRYSCTPYSSLGAGQTSPSIDIVVRGSLINVRTCQKRLKLSKKAADYYHSNHKFAYFVFYIFCFLCISLLFHLVTMCDCHTE